MPWYEGETLERGMTRAPLTRREARRIFEPLARALATMHASDLRHQDIKPDNIFLAKNPRLRRRRGEPRHPAGADRPRRRRQRGRDGRRRDARVLRARGRGAVRVDRGQAPGDDEGGHLLARALAPERARAEHAGGRAGGGGRGVHRAPRDARARDAARARPALPDAVLRALALARSGRAAERGRVRGRAPRTDRARGAAPAHDAGDPVGRADRRGAPRRVRVDRLRVLEASGAAAHRGGARAARGGGREGGPHGRAGRARAARARSAQELRVEPAHAHPARGAAREPREPHRDARAAAHAAARVARARARARNDAAAGISRRCAAISRTRPRARTSCRRSSSGSGHAWRSSRWISTRRARSRSSSGAISATREAQLAARTTELDGVRGQLAAERARTTELERRATAAESARAAMERELVVARARVTELKRDLAAARRSGGGGGATGGGGGAGGGGATPGGEPTPSEPPAAPPGP